MAAFSTAAIGLRLALGGGRVGTVRLALVAIGVALGVSLLLVGLGVGPAREARNARELAREPVLPLRAPASGSYLVWSPQLDRFGGRPLFRAHVAGVGERPPLPPGIERLPAPGELAVSPALARLLRSREGTLLRPRVPGRIVEVVGKEGLAWPGELVAYAGAARGKASASDRFYAVTGFGSERARGRELPLPVKLVILVAVLGLLMPTLAFIAASSRVSAAARDRRLAAIRLVGATPGQARLLTAVESAVAAGVGCLAGVALFFTLRPFAAALAPEDHELFPSDIAPPAAQAAATLLAVPLLAIGAALIALRRVELGPLGIVRHVRVRRVGPLRGVPLVLGFTALVVAWLDRDELVRQSGRGDDTLALLLVGPGFMLVLLGVAAVTPWVAGLAARLLLRVSQNVGTLIAARRLVLEPTSAGRLVSGAVLAVFVATIAHAFLPALVGAADSESRVLSAARRGTLFVGTGASPDELASALRGVDGVHTVAVIGAVNAVAPPPASGLRGDFAVLVADCAALNRVLVQPLPRCTTASGYRLLPPSPYAVDVDAGDVVRLLVDPDRSRETVSFRLPNRLPTAPARPLFGDDVSVLLSPDVVPVGAALHTREGLVATDGSEHTVEHVRNALARAGILADVSTSRERIEERTKDARSIVALIDLATLLVLTIAAAGLLVASIDSVLERRRPFAVLVAVGTPVSLLRRAVLLQAAIPLACGLAVVAAAALLTSALVLPLTDAAIELPLRPLAILTAIAAVAVLVVSASTLPTLARAVRPENLRAE